MPEVKFYTDRSNARRAAERMLEKGEAPSCDYGLKQHEDGKWEIVWRTTAITAPVSPEATPEPATQEPEPPKARATKTKAEPAKPRQRAAAPATGAMPIRPVVTSAANQSYQARFDLLARMAEDGDWSGVKAYEVKGVNTYAKKLARYRDELLAAHLASA